MQDETSPSSETTEVCNPVTGTYLQATFQIIQSPANLIKLQKNQAEQRMDSYKKYEEALDKFQQQLEGIQVRQEKNQTIFNEMFKSLMKSSNKITQDIGTFQKEVATVAKDMTEALVSLDKGLAENNKKFEKNINAALDNLEIIHNIQEKRGAVEVAGAIGDMAKMIYDYVG